MVDTGVLSHYFPTMPSIFKRPRSPFYFCSYRAADGRWLKKSTKLTDRRKAFEFATNLEKATGLARRGTLTTSQARKLFNEILEMAGDDPLDDYTVKGWFTEWIEGKKASHATATAERYRKPLSDFLVHLGDRADLPLTAATPKDVRKFRDEQRKAGRAAATTNFAHKAVASVFAAAERQGYIRANPARAVDFLPVHAERVEKGTFSPSEVASLASAASPDWKGVILLGYFTGLRLADCLSLTWGNVDMQGRMLKITPRKTIRTGKTLLIPMHPDIEDFLLTHPAGKRDSDPLFPSVCKLGVGGNRGASRTFQGIMKKAGLVSGTLRDAAGKAGRKVAERSFHSLRHSFVSALSTAGIAVELRQKLAGHASEQQNLHYTHPEIAALRAAIDKLPGLSTKK